MNAKKQQQKTHFTDTHSVQNPRKASLLLFDINSCSFVHSGLNEFWHFVMLMLLFDVAARGGLFMFLTNDTSDIYLTPFSANHLFDQRSYGIRRYAAASQ